MNCPGKDWRRGTRFSSDVTWMLAVLTGAAWNLNMFLYPYDTFRLLERLEISSDVFINEYVDMVLRQDS